MASAQPFAHPIQSVSATFHIERLVNEQWVRIGGSFSSHGEMFHHGMKLLFEVLPRASTIRLVTYSRGVPQYKTYTTDKTYEG